MKAPHFDFLTIFGLRGEKRHSLLFQISYTFSALKYLTDADLDVVLSISDPHFANGSAAQPKLRRLPLGLVSLWALRKPLKIVRDKLQRPGKSPRD